VLGGTSCTAPGAVSRCCGVCLRASRLGRWSAALSIRTVVCGCCCELRLRVAAQRRATLGVHLQGLPPGTLGGTYGGNALGSAVASAVIDVIEEEGLLQNATDRGSQLAQV
jgi:Aminotransferase class-III